MSHAAPHTPTAATVGFALPHRTKMLILGSAVVAMFLSAVQHSIVATATPVLAADLGRIDLIAFMESAFMATSVPAVAIAGRMSDVYGRKPFLLAGLVIFAGATALAGFATSMEMLIGFRALQGIGGGILMGNTFSISGDLFPPSERAKYMGIFAAVFGVGGLVGPLLGGLIVDAFNWRWVFWSILPLAALAFASIAFIMPWLRPPPRKVVIDWLGIGAMLLALMPAMLALGLVSTGTAWLDIKTLALFGVSALGVVAFAGAERTAKEPILPGALFRDNTFRVAALVMAVIGGGLFGVAFFLAYFMQGVLGYSPTASGLLLSTEIVSLVIAASLGGQFVSRTGRYKAMSLVATVVIVISGWFMTQLSTETDAIDVVWRLVLFGAGLGILYPALLTAAQNALPQRMLGTVSGATQFFEEIGAIIGVTLVGALVTGRLTSELAARLPADLAEHADPTQLLSEGRERRAVGGSRRGGIPADHHRVAGGPGDRDHQQLLDFRGGWPRSIRGRPDLEGESGCAPARKTCRRCLRGPWAVRRRRDPLEAVASTNGAGGNGTPGRVWTDDPAPVARIRPQRSLAPPQGSRPGY